MEVWVTDPPDTINGQHPTSDATRVNNPYLVPATATSILAQFQTLGPHHETIHPMEMVTSVIQHCLSAKDIRKP